MRSPTVLFAVVVLAVTAVLALDLALGSPSAGTASSEDLAVAADAGAWFCAAGGTGPDQRLQVVAGVSGASARTSQVRIDTFQEGAVTVGPEVEVFPGTSLSRVVPAGADQVGVSTRWWRAPAAVSRIWRLATPGEPQGVVEGPCQPAPSSTWVLPGVSTAGGAQARLRLANPFDTDASMQLILATPAGERAPKLLENVVVPARSVREVLLNEHAPEEPDLGVVVRVRSGRVVAEGYQTVDAAVGGIEGVSLVAATPRTAETWTVPWFTEDREGTGATSTQSWLWVTNPGDEPAALALTLHTVDGGVVPEALDEVTVAAGAVQRVDLRGLLPAGGPPRGGVTVRSENGVPVAVSAGVQLGDPDPARTGLAVVLGATQADSRWVLAGAAADGRSDFLHLVNPTSEPAVVDVHLWSDLGGMAPPELSGLTVPPGALLSVDVGAHIPSGASHQTTFVVAREGAVVAGREAYARQGERTFTATVGVPSRTWQGETTVAPVRFAPGLPQRIGTDLGPQAPAVVVPGAPQPIPAEEEPIEAPTP